MIASRRLGLILLDTRFPRLPGDLGRPDSYPWPVITQVVPGAVPAQVVCSAQALRDSGLAERFVAAARSLVAEGADAITTSCGFLVLLQAQLQASVPVPVLSSSLLALRALLRRQPRVGVLTIRADRLGPEHLLAAGVPEHRLSDVLLQDLPEDGHFVTSILGNGVALDEARARLEVVQAAQALQARAPDLRQVVLECTNLPPYAQPVADATGWQLSTLLQSRRLLGDRALAQAPFINPLEADF